MSCYKKFQAKSVRTPAMLADLVQQSGDNLLLYFANAYGEQSFVQGVCVKADFQQLDLKMDNHHWFKYNRNMYISYAGLGMAARNENQSLAFANQHDALAYVAAVKLDRRAVRRQNKINADMEMRYAKPYRNVDGLITFT